MSYVRRHFDFERIYNEFLHVYSSREEAEREYYAWLNIMRLDESKEYGQARESFYWKKEDLKFIREDEYNKYYEVEIGFPTKSMNGNVYKRRDLVAAALTLAGKHPSLNHKMEFWFSPRNPRNRWGNIPIIEGKFHEGICKALVAVPKDMLCPICGHNEKMIRLIDTKRIVNVSLEGDCAGGRCPTTGECEGFYFTDPPFTFLTTDVLPGIPMTRIKPLESYMPSLNSQSSITRGKIKPKIIMENKKMVKIKPRIIEENTPPMPPTNVNTNTYINDVTGDWGTPIQSDAQLHSQTMSSGNATVQMGVNNEKQMQSGYPEANKQPPTPAPQEAIGEPCSPELRSCVDKLIADGEPEDSAWAKCRAQLGESVKEEDKTPPAGAPAPMTGPANDTTIPRPPEEDDVQATKTKPPVHVLDLPAGAPADFPAITKPETEVGEEPPKADDKTVTGDSPSEQAEPPLEPCPDGYHRDENGECVPDTDAAESIRRIKAEYEAAGLRKNIRYIESVWTDRFTKLKEQYQKVVNVGLKKDAVIAELRQNKRFIEEKLDRFQEQNGKTVQELRIELADYKGRYGSATRETSKYSKLVEELQIQKEELERKYHGALATNLKLSKDVTKANEDYLEIAKDRDSLKEALTRSRNEAKKILKIKA